MIFSIPFRSCHPRSCLRWTFLLAALSCANLHAQSSLPSAISSLPAGQSTTVGSDQDALPVAPSAGTPADSSAVRTAYVYDRTSSEGDSSQTSAWNQLLSDPFQPWARFSRSPGLNGSSTPNLDAFFEMSSRFNEDFDKYLKSVKTLATSKGSKVLPTLSQWERNGVRLPLDTPLGKLQFSYREIFGPGGNALGGGVGKAIAQASFNAASFKDNMFRFSATATYGALTGVNGFGGVGGRGHTQTPESISLKLTFK